MTHDDGRSRRRTVLVLFAVTVVCAVADFLRIRELGLLADDWSQIGRLVWGPEGADRIIHDLFVFGGEGRPLRSLDQSLLWLGHRIAGLPGAFACMALAVMATGWLVSVLVGRRLPHHLALLAGVLCVVHPCDTTHVWAATLNAKLGIVFGLAACLAFCHERRLLAYALCLGALFSYELSVLVFAMAPWYRDGGRRRSLVLGTAVAAGACLTYLAWRKLVFQRIAVDLRFELAAVGESTHSTGETLRSIVGAIPLTIFQWPAKAVSVVWERGFPECGLIAAAVLATAAVAAFALWPREPRAQEPAPAAAAGTILWGVIGLLWAGVLAFVQPPTLELSQFSRHNIALVPGAAVALTGIVALCRSLCPTRLRILVTLPVAALVLVFVAFRLHVQDDYVTSAAFQRRLMSRCIEDLGELPPHTIVMLSDPLAGYDREDPAMPPVVTGFDFEAVAIFNLVYDHTVHGNAYADAVNLQQGLAGATGQLLNERPLRYSVVLYDCPTRAVTWLNRGDLGGAKKIAPGGPALEYLSRPADP